MITTRRVFLTGLFAAIAAPAIVHIENIMPVRALVVAPRLVLPERVIRTSEMIWAMRPDLIGSRYGEPDRPEYVSIASDQRDQYGRFYLGVFPLTRSEQTYGWTPTSA